MTVATRDDELRDLPSGSVGDLTRRLGDDVTLLFKEHVELAKVELGRDIRRAFADVAATALAALIALIGFTLLCVTAVVALEPLIPPLWARMLIMSGVYLVIGGVAAAVFAKRLKRDAVPDLKRTKFEARRTGHVLKEQVQHG